MNKVIVFAGTTEGREICSFLKKYEIASLACTATEYGKCRIEEGGALTVRSGRLTEEEMEQLFGEEQPEMVIDATQDVYKRQDIRRVPALQRQRGERRLCCFPGKKYRK